MCWTCESYISETVSCNSLFVIASREKPGISINALNCARTRMRAFGNHILHRNSFLSDSQLVVVGGIVRALALNGTPVSRATLRTIIAVVASKSCSRQTVAKILARYPKILGEKKTKTASGGRLTEEDLKKGANRYATALAECSQVLHLDPHNVMAFDQYRFFKSKGDHAFTVRVVGGVRPDCRTESGDSATGSYMPFVTADGRVYLHVFVFACPGAKDDARVKLEILNEGREARSRPSSCPTLCFFADSGAVNNVVQSIAMKAAAAQFNLHNPGLKFLAICDNLKSYRQPDLLAELWKDQGMCVVFTPENTTHIYGTLDDVIFASLTKSFAAKRDRERLFACCPIAA